MGEEEKKGPEQKQRHRKGDKKGVEGAAPEKREPITEKRAGSWTSEELDELAEKILKGKSLPEAVESAYKEHPDLEQGVIEVIDEEELKP